MSIRTVTIAIGAFFLAGVAMADDQPLDVTISVVQSPDDLPAAVTKIIALPDAASDVARERSGKGMDTANQAREFGRTLGQGISEEAKSRGRGQGRP
jgi:hypothetical protein